MEVQGTYLYPGVSFQNPDDFFAKSFEEIPAFEEAFDPISLRKFFQEHESTNSQSAYSPRKEFSCTEDTHSQATDDHETLLSPASQYLTKNTPNETMDSRVNLPFNFNLNT